MVDSKQKFGMLFVLDSSLHVYFIVLHQAGVYNNSVKEKDTKIEAKYLIEKHDIESLPYWRKEIDGKLRQEDEKTIKAERRRPYLVRDRFTTTIDEMPRAVDRSEEGVLATSSVWSLMKIVKEKLCKGLWKLCRM